MKKNYLAKKLTAAMLAGTMVLSMGGMTAFAATEDFPLSIKKIVATDGKSYSPNTQFTFILEKGTVTSYTETKDGVKHTYPVTPGEIEGDDKQAEITKNPSTFGDEGAVSPTGYIKDDGQLKFYYSKFTEPGIYSFKLKEVQPENGYEGVTYSTEAYDILVYVTFNEDDVKEINVVSAKTTVDANLTTYDKDGLGTQEGTAKASEIAFENYYGGGTEVQDKLYNFTVKKVVSGSQANTDTPFTINVTVTDTDVSNERYNVIRYTKNDDGEDVKDDTVYTLNSGEKKPFTLTGDDYIEIYGVSENDLIEVNEDENSLGYTASYSKSGDTNSNLTASTTGVTGTIKDNNVLITVTNTRNPITPTGIAMTFAPYALMVLFAGGIAVLFLRKKKEDF